MHQIIVKTGILWAVLIVLTFSVAEIKGQYSPTVEWEGINGVDNELVFLIPAGFQISDDGTFSTGKGGNSVMIDNRRVVSRYINGTVLLMELYQGKAKKIQPLLASIWRSDLVKEETFGGFQAKTYIKKVSGLVWEQQHFFKEQTLYVFSAFYRTDRSEIVDNFFKSVRLTDGDKVIAPNFPKDAKKTEINTGLPDIKLEKVSEAVEEKPDVPALVVYRPKPAFNREFGKSNSGTVKMKVLFLPTGKIGKVELLSAPNITLADSVRNSAEHLVFLPALKNGQPIAVWQTVDYGFQMILTGI